MGKTYTKKVEAREDRLKQMPRGERYAKSAQIKRAEGRVLDANEKRAIKMKGSHGAILRAWEVLRASADKLDEKIDAMKRQAQMHSVDDSGAGVLAKEDFEAASGRRSAAVDKVLALLKPKFDDVARTPTVSRVIQSCIKFGTNEQRTRILTMFTPKFSEFCADSFAHFAIEALVRHATKPDFKIMLSLTLNSMSALATHKCGTRVVNALYNHKLCSATEKHNLVLGIFKDSVAVMKGWKGYPVLEDIIANEEAARRRILTLLFSVCDKLVGQKDAIEYPFVQRLVCVLFTRGAKEHVEELAVSLKPNLVPMTSSRDGAKLASLAFGVLPPKSRKVVLRALADHLAELVVGKNAPPFVCRCFDLTYDPQMMLKYVAGPVAANIGAVVASPYGYRIILHLLTPDAERKARVLLPNFDEHNLYSRSSTTWKHHTWYDAEFNEETVEVCPKSAEESHCVALRPIVKALLTEVCAPEKLEGNKTVRSFVARIASEALHLHQTEKAYRDAMQLTAADVELLEGLQSNKDRKVDPDCCAASTPADRSAGRKAERAAAPSASPAAATSAKKRGRAEGAGRVSTGVEQSVVISLDEATPPPRKSHQLATGRRSVNVEPTPVAAATPVSATKARKSATAAGSARKATGGDSAGKKRSSGRTTAVLDEL